MMKLFNRHIRMTASELAMGRYMRAPDHPTASEADDQFAAAFADFGKEDGPPAAETGGNNDGGAATGDGGGGAPTGEPPAATGDGGAPPAEAPPAAEPPAGGAGDAPPAEPGAAPGAAPAAAADDKGDKSGKPAGGDEPKVESEDDILKRLAAAVAKEKPAAEAPSSADEPPAETPLFTAEETAKIDKFKQEWPEVAEAFDLQARAMTSAILKYAFEQIGSVVGPMQETLGVLAHRTHTADLHEALGDEYSAEEVDAVKAWVDTQPKYLQAGMHGVIEEGTAEEVADLVSRYRKETGKTPAPKPAASDTPPADVELSGTAKQAAAALAPVDTKRSDVQATEDKSDYDANFVKFADMLG